MNKIDFIKKQGIVAIMRGVPAEKVVAVANASIAGGVPIIECTFEHHYENVNELLFEKLHKLTSEISGDVLFGAGTVLTPEQVEVTHKAGGSFIVTPVVNQAVIAKAKELGLISFIGAMTPTEIEFAHCCGADFVKVFPAGDMGAHYIKSVKAPLSHIDLIAVGDISIENIRSYLQAGAIGVGVGGLLFDKTAIEAENYEKITQLAKQYHDAVCECLG